MATKIIMPEMGEGVDEGTVVRWLKQQGDSVKRDEPVLEIETDKVTVEVMAESSGTLLQVNAKAGQTVKAGAVLAVIGAADEQIDAADTPAAVESAAPPPQPIAESAPAASQTAAVPAGASGASRDVGGARVSPVVARMLQVHDLDINALSGTGRDGRVTKQDVLDYLDRQDTAAGNGTPPAVKSQTEEAPAPASPPAPRPEISGGDTLMPLSGMRRSIAEHMVKSKQTSPHATTVFEFDFSAVAKHRAAHKAEFERDGVKLTYMPYLAAAAVQALKAHPLVNASWTDDGILLKREINLGIAVAVANGLLVPVVRGADALNLLGLARTINDLAERGRTNRLRPDEVKGGTFTITNHGTSGSLIGMPIINQPQVGILGIGVIEKRVKVIDDAIAIRPCAFVSFSFDHRILDGATADAFVMHIKRVIETWR